MDMTHSTPDLLAAMAKAQGEIENATKNAANPHFRSRYADLAEVLNTVRPVLAKHGLSVWQGTAFDGALVHVTTTIGHASGGYVSTTFSCVPAKTDAQGVGSATTYGRRYGLAAMAGIAQEDDDGQSAAHNTPPSRANPVTEKWLAAIDTAPDASALDDIALELAQDTTVPANEKARLRAAFAARKNQLKAAA